MSTAQHSGSALGCLLPSRTLVRLVGKDAIGLLQGVTSADIRRVEQGHAVWTALLTPQGRFLAEALVVADAEGDLLLEMDAAHEATWLSKLAMYKLRAQVSILPLKETWRVGARWWPAQLEMTWDEVCKTRGMVIERGECIVVRDPRDGALGERILAPHEQVLPWLQAHAAASDLTAYHTQRIMRGVPESVLDAQAERSLLLELHYDDLDVVSFTKGCYVGQEVTARTKHRAQLKKKIARVIAADGQALPAAGTPVMQGEEEIGVMCSSQGNIGLALVQLDCFADAAEEVAHVASVAVVLSVMKRQEN